MRCLPTGSPAVPTITDPSVVHRRARDARRSGHCYLLALVGLLAAGTGHAQDTDAGVPLDSALTLATGWRGGGGFTEAATGRRLATEARAAVSLSLDIAVDGSRQLQFFASRQSTRIAEPAAFAPALPLAITYLHVGGTNFFDGPIGTGPYVAGGLGATLFDPGLPGYAAAVRPSMNLGIGWQWTLGRQLALRLETRGYATLVNSQGGLFCDGGCTLQLRGDAFTQFDAQLGLSLRF